MPWKDKLNQVKNELSSLMGSSSQHQQQYSPQQHYPPPPPIPPHPEDQQAPPPIPPHPPLPPQEGPKVYWQPEFRPDVDVSREWEAKTGHGANGWGNQELQNYTSELKNAFHTHDGRLVLRAIVDADAATDDSDQRYTSARLVSRQTLARDRGALTATVLSPCAAGVWPAFWLLPREPFSWPADGEIDLAETWNGDGVNRSCLHWGRHEDQPDRHRVIATPVRDMRCRPVRYDFVWDQDPSSGDGRMLWYIDDVPVMKARAPRDMQRPLRDMTILLNVALGGNVCEGRVPAPGAYDMVVSRLFMAEEMDCGGWARFERDWCHPSVPEGNTY